MAGADTAGSANLLALFKRAVELCMPNLRHYYRVTRKARIVATYPAGGAYYADVQPLRNDDAPDPKEPVIPKVEIPVMWGGPKRGVICPPAVGTHCDLSYYDGDPNYPRISNFRWLGNEAPECDLSELIIQQEPGVSIKIDKAHKVITITPTDVETGAGQNWTINAGDNASITAGRNASITAARDAAITAQNITATAAAGATVQAAQINLVGNISSAGAGGAIGSSEEKSHKVHVGSYTLNGPQTVDGAIVCTGTITAAEFIGPVRGCTGCGG